MTCYTQAVQSQTEASKYAAYSHLKEKKGQIDSHKLSMQLRKKGK